jgi:hypothetical protein
MLNFDPTVIIESTSTPGVTFTIRRLSRVERANCELATLTAESACAALLQEMREIEGRYPDHWPKNEAGDRIVVRFPEITADDWLRYTSLNVEIRATMDAQIYPEYVRRGLVKIDGLEYAGKPASADLLISCGPDSLLEEIHSAVRENMGLTVAQVKTLPSPTTSTAQGQEGDTLTSAATAS